MNYNKISVWQVLFMLLISAFRNLWLCLKCLFVYASLLWWITAKYLKLWFNMEVLITHFQLASHLPYSHNTWSSVIQLIHYNLDSICHIHHPSFTQNSGNISTCCTFWSHPYCTHKWRYVCNVRVHFRTPHHASPFPSPLLADLVGLP